MLTMLGIIIGVGAVITMVALGTGAQKAVEDRIAALGANVFTVFAGQGRSGAIMITDRTVLSTDDYEALLRDATLLKRRRARGPAGAAGGLRQPEPQPAGHRHHGQLHRRPELHACPTAGCSPTATTRPASATRSSARRCPRCSAATRPP